MRMHEANGTIMFEVGDTVRPRTVFKRDEVTGKPVKALHDKATGGIKTDEAKTTVVERGLPDVVAYVDTGSMQIQLQSWIEAGITVKQNEDTGRDQKVPSRLHSFRTRLESYEWYEAIDPDEVPAVAAKPNKREATGAAKQL